MDDELGSWPQIDWQMALPFPSSLSSEQKSYSVQHIHEPTLEWLQDFRRLLWYCTTYPYYHWCDSPSSNRGCCRGVYALVDQKEVTDAKCQ